MYTRPGRECTIRPNRPKTMAMLYLTLVGCGKYITEDVIARSGLYLVSICIVHSSRTPSISLDKKEDQFEQDQGKLDVNSSIRTQTNQSVFSQSPASISLTQYEACLPNLARPTWRRGKRHAESHPKAEHYISRSPKRIAVAATTPDH